MPTVGMKRIVFDGLEDYGTSWRHPRTVMASGRMAATGIRHAFDEGYTSLSYDDTRDTLDFMLRHETYVSGLVTAGVVIASNSWQGLRLFYARSSA